jgi:hypothetical protein
VAEAETRAAQGTLPTPQDLISSLNLPKLRTTQDIWNTYSQIPAWHTPKGRALLEPSFRIEVQQNEELRRTQQQLYTDIAIKQAGVQSMMANRALWARLPDFYKAELTAGAYGIRAPMVGMGSMVSTQKKDVDLGTLERQFPGISKKWQLDPTRTPTVTAYWHPYDLYMGGGTMENTEPFMVTGVTPQVAPALTEEGTLKYQPKIAGGPAGLPQKALQRVTGVEIDPETGQPRTLTSMFLGRPGKTVETPGLPTGVFMGEQPTRSITTRPGEPPTTVLRERIPRGGVQGVGGGKGAAAAGVSDDPLAEAMYNDWMQGKRVLNPREQVYVTQWAIRHGKPTSPDVTLTPTGQRALADLDPVIAEVQRTLNMLEQRMAPGGWIDRYGNHQPPLSKLDLVRDYTEYSKGHFDTPNSDLISNISFAGLRSGAQAMKGTGSRAYPVLEKALEHTPIVSVNFDSPKAGQTKLREMLQRLAEGREAILRDERKSGVIAPGGPVLPLQPGQNIIWSKDEKGNRIGKDAQGNIVVRAPASR